MEQPETADSPKVEKPSPLVTRIVDLFSSPSGLWREVAAMPVQRSSWVVPYVLSLVIIVLFSIALYNNESLRNQIFETQLQAMQNAVEEGSMTQEQLERIEDQMENVSMTTFVLFGSISQTFVLSIMFFGTALFLWLGAKVALKANTGYGKLLEVTGLVSFVGLLGSIITVLLMYSIDSLYATPSLALAVFDSFDPKNKLHVLFSSLNVFTLWEATLVGLALSKISGKSTGTGMGVAFALWGVWVVLSVAFGLGVR